MTDVLRVEDIQKAIEALNSIERETAMMRRRMALDRIRESAASIVRAERRLKDGIPRSTQAHQRNQGRLARLQRKHAEMVAEYMANE